VTYTRCRIDTINSPDDGHMAASSWLFTKIRRQIRSFSKIVV